MVPLALMASLALMAPLALMVPLVLMVRLALMVPLALMAPVALMVPPGSLIPLMVSLAGLVEGHVCLEGRERAVVKKIIIHVRNLHNQNKRVGPHPSALHTC